MLFHLTLIFCCQLAGEAVTRATGVARSRVGAANADCSSLTPRRWPSGVK